MSWLGAFIVRSWRANVGALFAVDPERQGLYILLFLLAVVGGSLTLYALRAGRVAVHVAYGMLSREFFYAHVTNVILAISLADVLRGTLAPLAYGSGSTGAKISVGPPFLNAFYAPLG